MRAGLTLLMAVATFACATEPTTFVRGAELSALVIEPLESPCGAGSRLPALTRGADERVYLTWVEQVGDQASLRFAVLEEGGWSAPRQIMRGSDLFLNWADFPSICALEGGELMAQWLREGAEPHGYSAEFSLSEDSGMTWEAAMPLHTDRSLTEHGFVSLAPLDGQTFGAIWLDGRNMAGREHGEGEMCLYFRPVSLATGLGEEQVIDTRVCDCCQTGLTIAADGTAVAVYRDRSEGEIRDVSRSYFDGSRWSLPEPVHGDGWLIDGCPVNGPRVVQAGDLVAASWFTGVGPGGGSVLVAFSSDATAEFGAPIDVDDGRPVGRVDLIPLSGDAVLVSWMEYVGEGDAEWRVREVGADGTVGDSMAVGVIPSGRQSGFLRMAPRPGGAVLAWTWPDPEPGVETLGLRVRE